MPSLPKHKIAIAICLLSFINIWAQKASCACKQHQVDEEETSLCDTTLFKNGAKLYWQFNCDSAWLTFENKQKLILKSCEEGDVNWCQKIGLSFLKEYPNYLLFMDALISGCCTPPDIVFLSKETGKEIKRLRSGLFINGSVDDDYNLYFADTTYKKIVYLNHNNNNQYSIPFTKEKLLGSIKKNMPLELNNLFENFKKDDDYFTFDFTNAKGQVETLKIKIK